MEVEEKPKMVLVPYPAQGHVTPMAKLASVFLGRGFQPIIVAPECIHRRITSGQGSDVTFLPIPDGIDDETPQDFFAIETAMETVMPAHFDRLLGVLEGGGGGGVACVVVDLLASWAVDVAERRGIVVAGFWPAMLATYRLIQAIPELIQLGIISDTGTPRNQERRFCLPDQPPFSGEDLPWLVGTPAARKGRFRFWTRTFRRCRRLKWLLVNSFHDEYKIEHEKTEDMSTSSDTSRPRAIAVGPLINRSRVVVNGPSFWDKDFSCLDWLDEQEPNSVVYVSFGSWVTPIASSKIRSLAQALESSNRPFIWVLGRAWREGLPRGYVERLTLTKNQGKIVEWAPQAEILRHRAVRCHLTHCGWNSIMEAVQCAKGLLCCPVAGDQFVNREYVVGIWRVGADVGSGLGQREVLEGLRKVMDEDGEALDKRMMRLRERVVGEAACSRAAEDLTSFLDDVMK